MIRAARKKTGLSQAEAGELIYKSLRQWQRYESGEEEMSKGYWELFQIKTKDR